MATDASTFFQETAVVGDARFAVVQVWFSTIPVMRTDQRYPGTEPGVIVDMHVVWNTEFSYQLVNASRVIGKMMGFYAIRPCGAEQPEQRWQLPRHGKHQVWKVAG